MEELYTILSSSARLDKSKRKTKNKKRPRPSLSTDPDTLEDDHAEEKASNSNDEDDEETQHHSRDRTGKRDVSDEKRKQIHKEQIAAFRRSMAIRVGNKHDPDLPDPISSFGEITCPSWWASHPSFDATSMLFGGLSSAILRNIELGKWKEPTAVQMQTIPTLLERRDVIGAAPTGSGKSGAFIIPALLLSSAPYQVYYGSLDAPAPQSKKKKKRKSTGKDDDPKAKAGKEGEIRSILLAPSRELAAQLHREVERIGLGKPGGLASLMLSKSNAAHVIAGTAGGKNGLDILVTTPMRLVDAIEKGLRLDSTRLVVMDEADRLLDAADGKTAHHKAGDSSSEEEDEDELPKKKKAKQSNQKSEELQQQISGSSQSKTFLSQMDTILSAVPSSAVRGLFSATVTPLVKELSESILRNPVDLKIAAPGSYGGANTDIEQELMFVGREEGKLLAMRQLKARGDLKPPVIVFVQSQERAQALFSELLYEGMHVDCIHAGRSKTARDNAVAKFRKGETWVLICTDLVARGVDFRAVNMVINYDLPVSGITYVHRIGRTGRAGRKGKAITLFTEADFDNLRTIANVMKQSGCQVEDWMLQLRKTSNRKNRVAPRRPKIDTTAGYDKAKKWKKQQMIQHTKKQKYDNKEKK